MTYYLNIFNYWPTLDRVLCQRLWLGITQNSDYINTCCDPTWVLQTVAQCLTDWATITYFSFYFPVTFILQFLHISYPEICHADLKCTLWTFIQWLAVKMRVHCGISIVLVSTSSQNHFGVQFVWLYILLITCVPIHYVHLCATGGVCIKVGNFILEWKLFLDFSVISRMLFHVMESETWRVDNANNSSSAPNQCSKAKM